MAKIEYPILSSFIFVHSALDDAGLSANEFRVYAHLARRAGAGSAFPAVASIAEVCRIHKDTVWGVLKSLEMRGMIARLSRNGLSNIYRLTSPDAWTHPSDSATGKEGAPEMEGWGAPENKGYPPPETEGYEGTPSKVLHLRESKEQRENGGLLSSSTELIYQAYPRKVGKLQALKAIAKALKLADFDTLMGAVKRFSDKAKAERTEERFIPHPATWFNAGRWMDGQETESEPAPDYTDRKVWPNGNPANWPKHWIRHPTENRPMRPGEVP